MSEENTPADATDQELWEQHPDLRHSADELTFNSLPNHLTLFRIFMVPVMVGLLFMETVFWDWVAVGVFIVAAITDYFDGYYARTLKLTSLYGKLLDPLADKFLIISALIMLQHLDRIYPVVVILLICRELAITGLRALASAEGVIIPATSLAKWKTATQMVAIPCLMAKEGLWWIPTYEIGHGLLYLSLIISLWSAKDYLVDFFKEMHRIRQLRVAARREFRERRKAERRKSKTSYSS